MESPSVSYTLVQKIELSLLLLLSSPSLPLSPYDKKYFPFSLFSHIMSKCSWANCHEIIDINMLSRKKGSRFCPSIGKKRKKNCPAFGFH